MAGQKTTGYSRYGLLCVALGWHGQDCGHCQGHRFMPQRVNLIVYTLKNKHSEHKDPRMDCGL